MSPSAVTFVLSELKEIFSKILFKTSRNNENGLSAPNFFEN